MNDASPIENPDDRNARPGVTRDAFMRRIRAALERSDLDGPLPPGSPPEVDESIVRLADDSSDDLVERFGAAAQQAGMRVESTTSDRLEKTLASSIERLGIHSLTLSLANPEILSLVRRAIDRAGARIVDPRSTPNLEGHYTVDAGLTDVRAAIAESGTLCLVHDANHNRGSHLVPPIHIALVHASRIVADLLDVWDLIDPDRGADRPAATTLITGPSKTADIEGILITGVHGPGLVHVIVVADG